jgi:choline kinase
MKVIILAAGVGSRLKPFTINMPKCLFKLGKNETILEQMICIIRKYADAEICIVTGFQHTRVEQVAAGLTVVHNPFFRVTNSISSLWFARAYLDDDTVLINSDLVFEESLFKEVLEFDSPTFVAMDSSKKSEADYKVATFNNRVVMMDKDLHTFAGEYVGITRLSKDAALRLKRKIEEMVMYGQIDEWYETALVSMILDDNFELSYCDVPQFTWTEIDTSDDLLEAKRIYEMGKLRNE